MRQVAALNRANDPQAMRKRGKLMLPPPQVTDRELEDVVKASATTFMDEEGAGATRALMSSYEQTPEPEHHLPKASAFLPWQVRDARAEHPRDDPQLGAAHIRKVRRAHGAAHAMRY